ncbi:MULTISPECIES: D-lyxose/D-mannose family sugar isomerase [unclassified Enterococcus]|uniref:D-lyxose/D-mannose family sugar isomerase n=1 Tax=unclassified Enterococcus TaxID=2608891 RepID=UPI0013EAD4D7|nr:MULTISPECIES: D-lyxose/D-mannose family sugar isomerase [unclassified Enterococcus]
MKRSMINHIIDETIEFTKERGLVYPRFAYFTQKDWEDLTKQSQEIIDNMLGWDVTDFGEGNYSVKGLTSFTFRNGNYNHPEQYPKPYCEKLLIVEDGQELPFHFHWKKMEDIINRGGGVLEITLYHADEQDQLDKHSDVSYVSDGQSFTVPAGTVVRLFPGSSITLMPRVYHKWKGIKGTGKIMLFEVSSTNDDKTDNRFLEDIPRLISIEEDDQPKYYLFSDYDTINLKE